MPASDCGPVMYSYSSMLIVNARPWVAPKIERQQRVNKDYKIVMKHDC